MIADSERMYTYGAVNYYSYDPHGSVVSSGGKTYTYDAFGNQTNDIANDTNPFRYNGEYFDNETGYIYLRARYYDPSIGRFTTEDPIKDGLNWYVYCSNNPVMFVDPSGLTYLVAWSYGSKDVKEYERYRKDSGYDISVDGDTSDWDDSTWSDFTNRSSFARAAYTRKQELLDKGIPEYDIDVQRIDNIEDLETTWNMWSGYSVVEKLDFYSHGYGESAEVYDGSGDFWETATKLNWMSTLRQLTINGNTNSFVLNPYAAFYGCNTANGSFAQNFANTQNVTTYAQTDYASFSHTPTYRTRIKTHDTSKDIYLLSFESWGGLRNDDGLGMRFDPQ